MNSLKNTKKIQIFQIETKYIPRFMVRQIAPIEIQLLISTSKSWLDN